jgi:predicted DNA-binding protein YlxM (UPF0122 family)
MPWNEEYGCSLWRTALGFRPAGNIVPFPAYKFLPLGVNFRGRLVPEAVPWHITALLCVLPEEYIVKDDKRRQVMDIINRLSEVQRVTVLLFYYDELSVKEIAEIMECSESTVTSRLSYAKKRIRQEVEKLEKMGDKLYGVAPIPFLTLLFKEDARAVAISEADMEMVRQQVLSGISQGLTDALAQQPLHETAVSKEAATSAGKSFISKFTASFARMGTAAKTAVIQLP